MCHSLQKLASMKRTMLPAPCDNCLPVISSYKQKCSILSHHIDRIERKCEKLEQSCNEWKAKYEDLAG